MMSSSKISQSPLSQAILKASLAMIVLLPLNIILFFWNTISGLRYISTPPPPAYDMFSRLMNFLLLYITPPLLFAGAGAYIGRKLPEKGFRHGALFGIMWTAIIFFSIQLQFVVLMLNGVYIGKDDIFTRWLGTFFASGIIGLVITVLAGIGGALGQRSMTKK